MKRENKIKSTVNDLNNIDHKTQEKEVEGSRTK